MQACYRCSWLFHGEILNFVQKRIHEFYKLIPRGLSVLSIISPRGNTNARRFDRKTVSDIKKSERKRTDRSTSD